MLAGWQWNVDVLKRLLPGLIAMNPVTAIGFMLAGAALWLQRRPTGGPRRGSARWLAGGVLAIGALGLGNSFLDLNLGFDRILFAARLEADGPLPNRIAPNTALNFLLLGLALLNLDATTRRGFRPAEALAGVAGLVALFALIGYAYQVQWLYGVAAFVPMALPTAALFLLLVGGLLAARSHVGLTALLVGESPGGRLFRRLFPAVAGVQIVFGGLALAGARHGLYGSDLAIALLVGANVVVFGGLLAWNARSLHRAEAARRGEADERQRHARALEEANRELEAFSYSVSHDLRTPLRHLVAYSEILAEDAGGRLDDTSRRHLERIRAAADEMRRLIEDLLAFSRTATVPLHTRDVSLSELVTACVHRLELETRDRSLLWRLPPLPDVRADPNLLRQVLANLLGNALKYTRGRAPAVIEVGCAGREDDRLVFFVRDNGAGFDPQQAHRLFGVFQRLHSAAEFEGTGLGLALVRRIVARHDGRIWASGEVDRGATFFFTLAAATGAAHSALQEEAAIQPPLRAADRAPIPPVSSNRTEGRP